MPEKKTSMKSLRAYEIIRDMILKGQKLPGSRLIIADLEKELGIKKGPIREAIMRLDRSGLVKNIPYKGALVATPPTPKEILYIYEIRKELESKLAVEALKNTTDSDIAELEKLHNIMLEMPVNHYQYDREFHYHIYRLANLPHLFNITTAHILAVESVLNVYRREKRHIIKFNSQHYKIIEALKSGDPEEVRRKMKDNIEGGMAIIKETYDNLINQPFE